MKRGGISSTEPELHELYTRTMALGCGVCSKDDNATWELKNNNNNNKNNNKTPHSKPAAQIN